MASVHGTAANSLAVSVHGPAGVLDLVVPLAASAVDVAREYAEQSGLAAVPTLCTRLGRPLPPDAVLGDSGFRSGDLLVATTEADLAGPAPTRRPLLTRSSAPPGPVTALWFAVAAGVATLAGWFAARAGTLGARDGGRRPAAARGAGRGGSRSVATPGTARSPRRRSAPRPRSPWSGTPIWSGCPWSSASPRSRAAVTAAVGRALGDDVEEGLRVWMITGGAVFLATGLTGLLGLSAAVAWSVLLVGAMFAARVVPGLAIDVPDQLLIDLERLAVTAWSARDRPRGRRGRAVASSTAVAAVAARGTRLVTAATIAIAAVAVVASAMLLETVTGHTDRIGARCLVFFAGGALLLAARSYRHPAARAMLRAAGLGAWAWLVVAILRDTEGTPVTVLALVGHRPGAGPRRRRRGHRAGLALRLVGQAGRGRRGSLRCRGPGVGVRGGRAVPAGLGTDVHRREVVVLGGTSRRTNGETRQPTGVPGRHSR